MYILNDIFLNDFVFFLVNINIIDGSVLCVNFFHFSSSLVIMVIISYFLVIFTNFFVKQFDLIFTHYNVFFTNHNSQPPHHS